MSGPHARTHQRHASTWPIAPSTSRALTAAAPLIALLAAGCVDLGQPCGGPLCPTDGGPKSHVDAGGQQSDAAVDAGTPDAGAEDSSVFDAGRGDAGADAGNGLIETVLPTSLLCDPPTFVTRTAPSARLADDVDAGLLAPTSYVWDTGAGRVLAEAARGYAPTFTPGRVGFGRNGRPHVRDKDFAWQVLRDDGTWLRIDLLAVARLSLRAQGLDWQPAPPPNYGPLPRHADGDVTWESRVVFDADCHAYALLVASRSSLGKSVLLHSPNGGRSWRAYPIGGSEGVNQGVSLEVPQRSGQPLRAPPVLLLHQYYATSLDGGWTSPNTLDAVLPRKRPDGGLELGAPLRVASQSLLIAASGGHDSHAISDGDLVHVAYPGDSVRRDLRTGKLGTPAYVVTVDRVGRTVGPPTFLGVGVDPTDQQQADEHNAPVLNLDEQGILHAVISGHGGPMTYRRALVAHRSDSWTAEELVGLPEDAGVLHEYTYPSLYVTHDGRPLVLARYATAERYVHDLVRITRDASGRWAQDSLVTPGRPGYAHWYHKLSVDPWQRLFVSYEYYPGNFYADESATFAQTYGVTLTPLDSSCVPTPRTAPEPRRYCDYFGYQSVNATVLLAEDATASFRLATTRTFFF